MQVTTLSVLATDQGGAAVFHWHRVSDPVSRSIVYSLLALPHERRPDAVVRFAFEYIENIAAAPSWWDSLPDGNRESLIERMGVDGSGLHLHQDDGLREDGREFQAFSVRRTVRRRLG